MTEIDYPDNGKTTTTYNDTATPPNVVQTQLITSTLTKTMQTTFDSFGRPVQTAMTSDPSGTTYAARTFDSLGELPRLITQHGVIRPPRTAIQRAPGVIAQQITMPLAG